MSLSAGLPIAPYGLYAIYEAAALIRLYYHETAARLGRLLSGGNNDVILVYRDYGIVSGYRSDCSGGRWQNGGEAGKVVNEIKLITIHKRNVEILNAQKARLGLHCPLYLETQLEHEINAIKELEDTLRRRLHALLEKAAVYGISADPSISIEIEDIQKYFEVEVE